MIASSTPPAVGLARLGRVFYGAALVGSGLQQVVTAEFVRLVPKLPSWVPVPAAWAVGVGAVLMVAGAAILADRGRRPAAVGVGGLLLLLFVVIKVPEILANPGAGFVWTNPCKVLALLGGAALVAALPVGSAAPPTGMVLTARVAPVLLAVFLLVGGVQHFVYAGFVDTLVPAWLSVARFWTCFTGVALLAGGVGIVVPRVAWLAAVLSGVMILLWVVLLHLPRTVQLRSTFELAGVFEALALAGVAWLVAGGSRRSV